MSHEFESNINNTISCHGYLTCLKVGVGVGGGGGCVCVRVGFWLQSGICFGFYPCNWGHTAKRGYPQFLVRAVYNITGAIGCVKAPHLAIGL